MSTPGYRDKSCGSLSTGSTTALRIWADESRVFTMSTVAEQQVPAVLQLNLRPEGELVVDDDLAVVGIGAEAMTVGAVTQRDLAVEFADAKPEPEALRLPVHVLNRRRHQGERGR